MIESKKHNNMNKCTGITKIKRWLQSNKNEKKERGDYFQAQCKLHSIIEAQLDMASFDR